MSKEIITIIVKSMGALIGFAGMKIFFTRTKESMNVIFMVKLLNRNINRNKFESKKRCIFSNNRKR